MRNSQNTFILNHQICQVYLMPLIIWLSKTIPQHSKENKKTERLQHIPSSNRHSDKQQGSAPDNQTENDILIKELRSRKLDFHQNWQGKLLNINRQRTLHSLALTWFTNETSVSKQPRSEGTKNSKALQS